MPTTHRPTVTPPTCDVILRTRLAALIDLHAPSTAEAAKRAGWSESTLYRRLHTDPTDRDNYRRLHASDLDAMLGALGLDPDAVLQPVLLDGDRDLLVWVAERTPADPLPSRAGWADQCEGAAGRRLRRLVRQGLLQVFGDPDDPHTWYIRLTPAGQRALH